MLIKDLSYYQFCFINLSVSRFGDKVAPHKPLLLLSLIDLIEADVITSPQVELSEDLVGMFLRNADLFAKDIKHYRPNIGMPFYYMRSEPFWQLVPKVDGVTPVANTITSLRQHYAHAKIDDELFTLLQDSTTAQTLRVTLIETYLLTK